MSCTLIATLNLVGSPLLHTHQASLSASAAGELGAREGDAVEVTHAPALESMCAVRAKIHGLVIDDAQLAGIVTDIAGERYTEMQIAAFLAACAGGRMNEQEVIGLTRAMIGTGEQLRWDRGVVADKHCVGGLPGNRTTPIIGAIVAAAGLTIPKTSSRAIASPAGTADTMETLTRVTLDVHELRRVVERTGAALAWGGALNLSPSDDVMIRVERALDIDSDAQLVASILSKKVAAGATHVLIDVPVGPTAKVRSEADLLRLESLMQRVAGAFGLQVVMVHTDGAQPVGRGIGPALEAQNGHERPFGNRHLFGCCQSLARRCRTSDPAASCPVRTLKQKATWRCFLLLSDHLSFGELPASFQDFLARSVHPCGVVPALDDGQAVRDLAVASAELDSHRTIRVLLGRDVIDRVGVVVVLLEEALGVVQADRPERIHRNVAWHRQFVDGLAIVLFWREAGVARVLVRIAAPAGGRADQVVDGVDLILPAEGAVEARVLGQGEQDVANLLQAGFIPVGQLELAGVLLVKLDRVLQFVDRLKVLGVRGIHQGADGHEGIPRSHVLLRDRAWLVVVRDELHVMVFIEHHQRHEALARVGQGDCGGTGRQVQNRERIERVAVHPDDGLVLD